MQHEYFDPKHCRHKRVRAAPTTSDVIRANSFFFIAGGSFFLFVPEIIWPPQN
jgi:hypothetical protein